MHHNFYTKKYKSQGMKDWARRQREANRQVSRPTIKEILGRIVKKAKAKLDF